MTVCGAYYGTGEVGADLRPKGTAICGRPEGHPPVSQDGIGHSPHPTVADLASDEGLTLAYEDRLAREMEAAKARGFSGYIDLIAEAKRALGEGG